MTEQTASMLERALEIAQELEEETSRHYCLASMLTLQLDEHSLERGAAEILEDRLAQKGRIIRLMDTLKQMKQEIALA